VKDLGPHRALIIGSATQMEALLPEAINFAKKHRAALQRVTTAYFTVGITMVQDTPEKP